MKKLLNLAIGLCALGPANSSKAEVQIVESLMQFQVNGANIFRQGDRADWGTFYNPRLSVAGLGTTDFNPGAGDSLILDRIFVKSNHWNGGNTPDGGGTNDNWITAAPLFKYSITLQASTATCSQAFRQALTHSNIILMLSIILGPVLPLL
ncbi:MAG: hypothetical protein RL549_1275 [Verrucomicrobiota bacterium]